MVSTVTVDVKSEVESSGIGGKEGDDWYVNVLDVESVDDSVAG